jgi:hypothetical protein
MRRGEREREKERERGKERDREAERERRGAADECVPQQHMHATAAHECVVGFMLFSIESTDG